MKLKDYTGLIIAIIGILMLLCIIIYQAKTEKAVPILIAVALMVNVFGVILHFKRNLKK